MTCPEIHLELDNLVTSCPFCGDCTGGSFVDETKCCDDMKKA